jgi:serine/threonine-protein kinase RsbW
MRVVEDAQIPAPSMAPATALERTRLTVACGPLARSVAGRVMGVLAARAQLPLDRVNDAVLLTDAICAHACGHVVGDRITLSIATAPERLELRVGPLRPSGGSALVASASLPGTGNVVQQLATISEVRRASAGEYLWIVIGPPTATTGDGRPA